MSTQALLKSDDLPSLPPNARSTALLSETPAPKHDVSEQNVSRACNEFSSLLGHERVVSNPTECFAHSNTPWSPAPPSHTPALVLLPATTADVSAIMKICSRRRIPVTAFCGGTSFSGALTATRGGVCIDFQRMSQVLAVHADDMDVVVQPAVGWQELNAQLASLGLFFPPDPGPGAKIGGMIAMGCSGTNAYRHGTMREWVISVTVVLADGTVVKTRHRPRKSSAGYDLTQLMVGSEGTLGLVTEAVLKVTSAPQNLHVAVATFPSTHAAVRTAVSLIGSGLPIDALELVDKHSMGAINLSGLSSKRWKESPTLFLKFSGSRYAMEDQIKMAQKAARENDCESFELSAEEDEIEVSWGARKTVGKSLLAMKKDPSDLFLTADAAVPISRLGDIIEETHQAISNAGFVGSTIGHLGDGNFHAVIVCDKAHKQTASKILADVQRRAVELEGTITGEHGIGLGLRDMLLHEIGDSGVDMMRRIKLALDPLCILNCDKVIRMEQGQ
ncbi:MAG: D-lactate dehydrogenase [Lasallia pustulata]|uniref:D-lactate dehydrogenase (cytochrome) n=1 Tax=Lasallia pustulata TaxID=136370 RepID=A0A5M8PFC0_9LECA|nr:MAG: D-lactate dehydrogenase [Lasallia pustulata]